MRFTFIFPGIALALLAGIAGCRVQTRPAVDLVSTFTPSALAIHTQLRDPSSTPLAQTSKERSVSSPQPAPSAKVRLVPTPAFQLCSPLASDPLSDLPQIISDPYRPPPPHHDERHQGVDFSYYRRNGRMSIEGVKIQSVLAGEIAAAVQDSFPFGNMVIVETHYADLPLPLAEKLSMAPGESLYTLYAHMSEPPPVKIGDGVVSCQVLGAVGKTGNAGVAHLHIETRLGPAGSTFAGMRYYDVHATQAEKDNYVFWSMSGVFRHFDPMELLSWKSH
jgi:murein DD-endopeptidase MepM/ murein hydrolase activator NlpD